MPYKSVTYVHRQWHYKPILNLQNNYIAAYEYKNLAKNHTIRTTIAPKLMHGLTNIPTFVRVNTTTVVCTEE